MQGQGFLSVSTILLITNLVFNNHLAFLVYKNNKSAASKVFCFLSIVLSFWLLANYFSFTYFLLDKSLFLIRLSFLFSVPLLALFLLLALTLPNEPLPVKTWKWPALIVVTIVFSILSLSPYVFTGVDISSGQPVPIPGPGIIPFTIFGVFFTGLTLFTLIRRAQTAAQEVRSQLLTVTAGVLILLALLIGTVFIPVVIYKNNTFVSLVPLYSLFFLFTTAYAIMRHRLFKFKLPFIELATLFLLLFPLLNILFSTSETSFTLNLFTFLGVLGIGLLLIKSVKSEIYHKEMAAQIAEQLKKANHQLKELDKLKMDFFSMASHQLRTPLSVIKGYVSLLMEGVYGGVEKNVSHVLDHLYENNERLIHLVDEFLNFNRLESGKLSYTFEPHDIAKIIQDTADALRMKAQSKKIDITFNVIGRTAPLVVDKEKIHHVAYNFIDNAIKYTPQEGHVTVTLLTDAQGATVRVQDTGIGFDERDHKHFFQKYFRGHNVERDRIAGTGLGLYVAHTFIAKHNGHVWALSEGPGKGSEFGFFVPATRRAQPKKPVSKGLKKSSVKSKKPRKYRR